MKEVWQAIYTKLTGDTLLMTMLKCDADHKMVQRGYNPKKLPFDDTHTEGVLFRQWTGVPISEGINVKDFTFLVASLSKESDTNASDVAERIIEILNNADLSAPGGYFYTCLWDSYDSGVYWNDEDDAWAQDLRFKIVAAKD